MEQNRLEQDYIHVVTIGLSQVAYQKNEFASRREFVFETVVTSCTEFIIKKTVSVLVSFPG